MAKRPKVTSTRIAKAYEHTEKGVMRPEVGLQSEFKKRKPSARYRYAPSLDPELSWDVNAVRLRRLRQDI